jgi:hypothetical protein
MRYRLLLLLLLPGSEIATLEFWYITTARVRTRVTSCSHCDLFDVTSSREASPLSCVYPHVLPEPRHSRGEL